MEHVLKEEPRKISVFVKFQNRWFEVHYGDQNPVRLLPNFDDLDMHGAIGRGDIVVDDASQAAYLMADAFTVNM